MNPVMVRFIVVIFSAFFLITPCLRAESHVKQHNISLDWSSFFVPGEESLMLPSMHFTGAVYGSDFPGIPLYSKRLPVSVPHFSYEFSLEDYEIVVCNDAETNFLEESGFSDTDFKVISDMETSAGNQYSVWQIVPVRKREGVYEKLESFSLVAKWTFDPEVKQGGKHSYPSSSIFAQGIWHRLCVENEGIYRITHQDLINMGANPSQIDKASIRLFGNGGGMLPESNAVSRYTDPQENAIWVSGGNSGSFSSDDYILFYGQSPNQWEYDQQDNFFRKIPHLYARESCYFITWGGEAGKRISDRENLDTDPSFVVNTFRDYAHHERNITNLLGSGKIWVGELFDVTLTRDFSFSFDHLTQNEEVSILVDAVARSGGVSSFSIEAGSTTTSLAISGVTLTSATGVFARNARTLFQAAPQGNTVNLRLSYNRPSTGSRGWLNYITVNATRDLIKTGYQMFFRHPGSVGEGNVAQFQIQGVEQGMKIWDVTNPQNVINQSYNVSGQSANFVTATPVLREFVVFENSQYLKPRLAGSVANQNLHASQVHDLIIVVPDVFREQAERLAEFRKSFDGLSVKLVSPREIYNEFSSGVPDISAIRNFMKMYYDRAAQTGEYPKYLLLFGNGTYDNLNRLGYGGNFIPTFQTIQSLNPQNSYITDDFFGLLDDNEGFDAQGAIDLGIGRFPVRTVDEARFVVDKILRYNERIDGLQPGSEDPRFAGVVPNYADWRNVIALIADDEDGNVHFNDTEKIANYMEAVHPVYNIEKIYLDAYDQITLAGGSRYPEVNKAINNRVNQGALLINYVGHGGTLGLAHERILTFDDILSWGNFYNLPVFMTATCEFSSFDQPDANALSAGVRVFLKPDGGAAALFTTTRLAFSFSNFTLNDAFMRNAFKPMENGEMPRLGDLIRIAKVQSSSTTQLKNFVLLGDPSMRLAYPQFKAITTQVPDTIRALEKVTIAGEIQSPDGTRADWYNGVIYPTIFDKKATFSTLGNDPGSTPAEFTMRDRILYRGKASVSNGEFEFSFIVPRDINYNIGLGKISYYFDDGELIDGHGYFDNFIIAGTSQDHFADNQGPEISLYLNDRTFQSGDKTGPSPVLLAYLQDESGINTTGHIGHDIVAFLNDDTSSPYILNQFYQADLDSWQSGRVVYPFFNLEKGNYTLTLRAWDAHNNVSLSSIEFVVTSAPGIELSELLNIPNPMADYTTFSVEHNKPATEMQVRIDIYSLTGQLVKVIEQNIYASGFNIPPIEWDGRDQGGALLENGVYVFRAHITTQDGDSSQRTEKLIILR